MSDDTPQVESSTPVQLARIEGKIDLIKYQGEVFARDMTIVKADVAKLKVDVHTLQLEAAGRDSTAKTVAETLKTKEEEAVNNSNLKWTPMARFITTIVGIGVFADMILRIFFNK